MCGAEPLVSMDSAETVDAFYKLLEERKRFAASRSVEATPRWPAARNDHYCDQEVCHHDVIDLSSLCEPSDSGSDWEPYITDDKKFFNIGYKTASRSEPSEVGSYRSDYMCLGDEYVVGASRSGKWSTNIT